MGFNSAFKEPVSHRRGLTTIHEHSAWELCPTKWHRTCWFLGVLRFPLSVSFHKCSYWYFIPVPFTLCHLRNWKMSL